MILSCVVCVILVIRFELARCHRRLLRLRRLLRTRVVRCVVLNLMCTLLFKLLIGRLSLFLLHRCSRLLWLLQPLRLSSRLRFVNGRKSWRLCRLRPLDMVPRGLH